MDTEHQALFVCRHQLVRCMDTATRAAWRLVCRQTCLDVLEASQDLRWLGGQAFSVRERVENPALYRPSSLPMGLMRKFKHLRCLGCNDMQSLTSLDGLPCSLLGLDLYNCVKIQDYTPLSQCTALRHLEVGFGLPLGGDPEQLAGVLQGLTSLSSLHLYGRAFGCEQQEAAVKALAGVLPALSQLTLLRMPAMLQSASGARVVAAGLCHLTRLLVLHLTCNRLGGAAALALAPALQAMPRLQALNLAYNRLTHKDLESDLGEALAGRSDLISLNLEGNSLRNEGAEALLPVLRSLPRLRCLNVRYCELATHGNRVLQRMAVDTPGLEVLL